MDLAFSADNRMEMKENKNIKKSLDIVGELKKLCNLRVMVIPIVIRVLGIVPKGLDKKTGEIENQRNYWNQPDHSTVMIG